MSPLPAVCVTHSRAAFPMGLEAQILHRNHVEAAALLNMVERKRLEIETLKVALLSVLSNKRNCVVVSGLEKLCCPLLD